jgi:hypothetical protein
MVDTVRDPPHWLKPLKTTRTPKRMVYIDCLTRYESEHGESSELWRAGAVGFTHWTHRTKEQVDTLDLFGTPDGLWSAVSDFCTVGKRVVAFTYDLAYQIRISKALVVLPELGWTLEKMVLERASAWALFKQDRRSLMIVDLRSWTPVEFSKIALDVERPLNVKANGSHSAYGDVAVAAERVEIIRSAVLKICAWLDTEDLGMFKPTGSGQSYSAFRKRFMDHRILVHDDQERLTVERRAMWAGRCEAWRHGRLTGGPFLELDMRQAYCRIAAECDVPTMAKSMIAQPTEARVLRAMETDAVLAEVEVVTSVPVLPCVRDGRTVWPVGRFTTWVWDPELSLAFAHCDHVRVRTAYRYARGPALQTFTKWTLDRIGNPALAGDRIVERVCKHWSRCLVGRLGLRFRAWEYFGDNDEPDLRLVTYIDDTEHVRTDMLLVGRDRLLLSGMREGSESVPQIPGWVMSECRRRLWTSLETVGLDHVVYVDTDSILVATRNARDGISRLTGDHPERWGEKGRWRGVTINGPRNLTLDADRRMSGLPLLAEQTGPLEFDGEIQWSLRESMRAGKLDRVTSAKRHFTFDAPDLRRQHNADGTTQPYRMDEPCT